MDFLSRRPLAAFALSFYVAASLFCEGNTVFRIVAAGVLLAAFLCLGLIFPRGNTQKAVTIILAGCMTASVFSFGLVDLYIPAKEVPAGFETDITGTVTKVNSAGSFGGTYVVEAEIGNVGSRRIMYCSSHGEFAVGDILSDRVIFTEPEEKYRGYYLSDGILGVCESLSDSVPTRLGEETGVKVTLSRIRSTLSSAFKSTMSRDSGGFASAIVLGDRSTVSAETEKHFQTLGVAHLLSISGTHLAVVFSFAGSSLKGRRRFLTFGIISAAVFGYMLLTGMSPSVVRAGAMMIFGMSAALFRRRSDPVTSLGGAVFLICLLDPLAILDIGLRLSFAGVIGVIVAASVKKKLSDNGREGALWTSFTVVAGTMTVTAVTLPLIWLRFGEVSLLMPLANLVMIPLVSVMITAFLFLLVFSSVTPIFVTLAATMDKCTAVILGGIGTFAKFCDPMLPLGWTLGAVVLIVLVGVLLLSSGKMKRIFAIVLSSFFVLSAVVSQITVTDAHSGLTFCRISAGKDDGVCFFSDGATVLVDCGQYSSAVIRAAEMGKNEGSGRIDALVLTCLYRRHSMTVIQLLDEYYVESLWIPAGVSGEDISIEESLRRVAADRGCPVYTYLPGEILNVGDATFLTPETYQSGGTAENVRFSVSAGGKTVSYSTDGTVTGDITVAGGRCKGTVFHENTVVSEKGATVCAAVVDGTVVSNAVRVKITYDGDVTIRDVSTSP